jgi:DNA-binding HxlR family transcriptional regulator
VGRSVASRQSAVGSRQSAVSSRQSAVSSRETSDGNRKPAARKSADKTPLALDRLIHERLRLGIVSALAVTDRLTFNELKRLLETTDGNLSVHARKLEEAGYLVCDKTFDERLPRTEYRLSAAGRRAFEKYLAHMEAIIRAAKP